jgi:hypothetical protein
MQQEHQKKRFRRWQRTIQLAVCSGTLKSAQQLLLQRCSGRTFVQLKCLRLCQKSLTHGSVNGRTSRLCTSRLCENSVVRPLCCTRCPPAACWNRSVHLLFPLAACPAEVKSDGCCLVVFVLLFIRDRTKINSCNPACIWTCALTGAHACGCLTNTTKCRCDRKRTEGGTALTVLACIYPG